MTPEQVGHARALLTQPDATISLIAWLLGVSRSMIYKYRPELQTDGPVSIVVPPAHAELESS